MQKPRSESGAIEMVEEEWLEASIGQQLRVIRVARGWSQRRLASEAGVQQQNLSLYEHGLAHPRLETLQRLVDVLGVALWIEPRKRERRDARKGDDGGAGESGAARRA